MARVLRVPVHQLTEGRIELDAATSRYVVKVHRLEVGANLLLFDPETAREADAALVVADQSRAELEVGALRTSTAVPKQRVTLLQALGKGDKPDQVVRDATVLGATRVIFFEAERSVVHGARDAKKLRLERIAVEAARQSYRGDLPKLEGPMSFEDVMALGGPGTRGVVLCWHETVRPLLNCLDPWQSDEELLVLIGPEGGLSSREIDAAIDATFVPASLGPFVLRTETAATVALGLVRGHADQHFGASE